MRAKQTLTDPSRKSTDTAPASVLADLGRQQLAVAADAACALLRGSEAMRAIQHQAAHEAAVRHQAAAQKLRESHEPAELVAIQSDLLRYDLQGATEYWQQITAAALQSQVEMMASATHLLNSDKGGALKSAMESFQAAITSGNGFLAGKPATTGSQARA
ncbi:phasin family protein [Polaromonas sp. YR568]|uniref:phasin family protein n=1 Tax=Polaromonas sp. YR568 TaxID=1855301 RepID=UPI003137CC67